MRAWFLAAEDCCSRCTQGSATIAGAALVDDGRSSTSRSTAASTSSDGGSGFDHVEVQPGVHGRGQLRLDGVGLAGVYVFTWKFLVWQYRSLPCVCSYDDVQLSNPRGMFNLKRQTARSSSSQPMQWLTLPGLCTRMIIHPILGSSKMYL